MIPIRVLVADDQQDELDEALSELSGFGERVHVETCLDAETAIALIDESYFDIAFIDLYLDKRDQDPFGQRVLTHLATRSPSCVPVLMTRYGRSRPTALLEAMDAQTGRELTVVDKGSQHYHDIISARFSRRLEQDWTLGDYSEIVAQLRNKQQRIAGLRPSVQAINDEVSRLLFAMFDEPANIPLLNGAPRLDLFSARQGQSESATSQAQLFYGIGGDSKKKEVRGLRCFLKIGPRDKILQEVHRYVSLVRIGVPSGFRVELISSAAGDALAGICYSFADAGSKEDIRSFDDLVANDALSDAEAIIDRLFDPNAKSWDGVIGPKVRFRDYYARLFGGVDFDLSIADALRFTRKDLPGEVTPAGDVYKATPSIHAHLPTREDLQNPYWRKERDSCLVHGDMHGGNLLIGEGGQVSMIDYATAGIGPRLADAAALAASIRLQRRIKDVPLGQLFTDVYAAEKALLRERNDELDQAYGGDTWFLLGRKVNEAALNNVAENGPITKELKRELAVTQWTYALSIFKLQRWTPVQRVHMLAWCAALSDVWLKP